MDTRSLTPKERFELIMECRDSGLSGCQWCREKGINPGTFYNWITRLRKEGYPDIPKPTGRNLSRKVLKQEVVKLDIIPDAAPEQTAFHASQTGHMPSFADSSNREPTIEICIGGSVIRMNNNISTHLFSMVLEKLGDIK